MSQPNLILITTDQMRGDCLSSLGRQPVQTPYLDNMAADGVRFDGAYCSIPSCIAARASIMTGQTPDSHGRLGYRDRVPWEYTTTLPGELQKAGYQTFAVGKMHFYPQRNAMGFERMVLHEGNQNWDDGFIDDYHEFVCEKTDGCITKNDHGLQDNSWVARPWHTEEYLHETNWTVTAALDVLRKRDPTRPFFLWLSFIKPHAPSDPPQAYWDMYIDEEMPPPAMGSWVGKGTDTFSPTWDVNCSRGQLTEKNLQRARAGYFGLISHIDAQLSRFFKVLQRHLFVPADEVFSIFTADHGEMLGDHHYWRKTVAYEGSAKVPFIVRGPAEMGLQERTTVGNVVELMDVMPTFLDAAGVDIPDTVEGTSLLPLARGESPPWRDYIHGEHSGPLGMQYLTDAQEKYIWHSKTGEEQLFDLREDPTELTNLADQPEHAERARLWRDRMIAHLQPRGDGLADKLRAL